MAGEHSVVAYEPTDADDDPRLTTIQAVAAICFIVGILGAVSLPFTLLRMHTGSIAGEYRVDYYQRDSQRVIDDSFWLTVSGLIGTGLSLGLVVGSLGLLHNAWWGRFILLQWAAATLAVGIPSSYFYARWLAPPWREQLAQVRQVIDSYMSIMGWAVGNLLAVGLLVFLNRPHIRAFLRRHPEEAQVKI